VPKVKAHVLEQDAKARFTTLLVADSAPEQEVMQGQLARVAPAKDGLRAAKAAVGAAQTALLAHARSADERACARSRALPG
jgi:hypothetical protein